MSAAGSESRRTIASLRSLDDEAAGSESRRTIASSRSSDDEPEWIDNDYVARTINRYSVLRKNLFQQHLLTNDANEHRALGAAIEMLDSKVDALLEIAIADLVIKQDQRASIRRITTRPKTEIMQHLMDFDNTIVGMHSSRAFDNARDELSAGIARALYLLRQT